MSLALLKQNLKRNTKVGRHLNSAEFWPEIKFDLTFSFETTLLQLLEMYKDLRDTFKPYKTTTHVINELLFLSKGLYDIINAFSLFAAAVFMPLFLTIEVLFWGDLTAALLALPYALYMSITTLVLGAAQLLRGLTEIIASPLVLLRMPLRALITGGSGWPKFENNPGLTLALDRGEDCLNKSLTADIIKELQDIVEHLNSKAIKAKSEDQNSDLRLDFLPHINVKTTEEIKNRGLPLQKNKIFIRAKNALKGHKNDTELEEAVREYFKLFRPSVQSDSDRSLGVNIAQKSFLKRDSI